MNFFFKLLEKVKNQAGATAVIIAIVLPMLIGFGALAVDVGYMCVTKNELQNVADASALAACRKLGTIYQGMTYSAQQTYVCGTDNDDITVIKGVADAVARSNKAGGKHIIVFDMTEGIEIDEVEIGDWDPSKTLPFNAQFDQPDAVRVRAHRDGDANGPITTFFAKIFGIDAVDVSADATAALLGQTTSEPGEIELPLGISTLAATPEKCDKDIMFSPTKDACAGWNTFFDEKKSDIKVRKILQGMIDGTVESPATTSGDEFNFIGGELSDPTFNELLLLFKDKGYDINADGNPVATQEVEGVVEPIIGHLDAATLATLADDPNVTINAPVVPLLDPITGDPSLYPDGGIETVQVFDPETGDPVLDADGNPTFTDNYILLTPRNKHVWPTKVVVYYEEGPDCGNPSGFTPIVGYATIQLTDVLPSPSKELYGKLMCELVIEDDSRGGGGDYGTKGNIPCLVE